MTPTDSIRLKYPDGFTIIGTGKVGSALALELHQKGFTIRSLFNRTLSVCEKIAERTDTSITGTFPKSDEELGGLVFLALPDDQIGAFAGQISTRISRPERFSWVHTSGGTPTGILQPLADAGAAVASFHPVQTFSGKNVKPVFDQAFVTLNGDKVLCDSLQQIVRILGGRPLPADDRQKTAIHLAAVFVCNYYAPLFAASAQILQDNGVEVPIGELFDPIVRQTVEGLLQNSPEEVLTGPVIRGDTGTIERHLEILAKSPQWKGLYCDLGMAVLQLARKKPDRDATGDDLLEKLLNRT